MARIIGYRERGVDVLFPSSFDPFHLRGESSSTLCPGELVSWRFVLPRRGTNLLVTTWTVAEGTVGHVASFAEPVMVTPVSLPSHPEHIPTNLPTARVVRWNGKR